MIRNSRESNASRVRGGRDTINYQRRLGQEPLEDRRLLAVVAVYDDPAFVDSAGFFDSESDNIQAALGSLGHTVATFAGTTAGDFAAGLAGADVALFPEFENGDLPAAFGPGAADEIAAFVSAGGGLVIHGTNFGGFAGEEVDVDFLNDVFGFSVIDGTSFLGGNASITGDAAGTAFDGGPATLPNNDGTSSLLPASLPAGSKVIYEDDATLETVVALMPHDSGKIAYLGWDWYDAVPVGGLDGGWNDVLDRAIEEVTGDGDGPTVDIVDVVPFAQTEGVTGIQIVFSEPVQGFTLDDLSLDRAFDGLGNLLVGSNATLSTNDDQTFILGNTKPLTAPLGIYTLSINDGGDPIADLDSNPLENTDTTQWERISQFKDWGDAPDAPYPTLAASGGAFHEIVPGFFLGAKVDSEPDGFASPDALGDDLTDRSDDEDGVFFLDPLSVGAAADIEVIASAPGLLDAWIDFDASGSWDPGEQIAVSTPLIAGSNIITVAVPSEVDLATTFARFRLSSTGGLSPDGRAIDGEVEDYAVEIVDAEPPTVDITDVAPDPRTTSVSSIEIVFSEPVVGFDLGDLILDLAGDGLGNRLTGSETLSSGDGQTYTLSGLDPITAAEGTYVLSLDAAASGITDAAGNPLANNGHDQWVRSDTTAPTVDVVDVTPDPRMNMAVDSIDIVFSEQVTGFDLADLNLERSFDGLGNLLTGSETLTSADGITYTLSGLAAVTGGIGDYTLTVIAAGSGIQDAGGNALAADASDQWRNAIILVFEEDEGEDGEV